MVATILFRTAALASAMVIVYGQHSVHHRAGGELYPNNIETAEASGGEVSTGIDWETSSPLLERGANKGESSVGGTTDPSPPVRRRKPDSMRGRTKSRRAAETESETESETSSSFSTVEPTSPERLLTAAPAAASATTLAPTEAKEGSPSPAPSPLPGDALSPFSGTPVPSTEFIATTPLLPAATTPAVEATPARVEISPPPTTGALTTSPLPISTPAPFVAPSYQGPSTIVPEETSAPAAVVTTPSMADLVFLATTAPIVQEMSPIAATDPSATPLPESTPSPVGDNFFFASTPTEGPATTQSPASAHTLARDSPAPVESEPPPTPTVNVVPTEASVAGADADFSGVDITDSSSGGGDGGDGGSDDGGVTDGLDSPDEFVFGTKLSSSEKKDVLLGASIIGAVAVAVVIVACVTARYRAAVSAREDEDGEDERVRGGGRTRKSLPTYRISPSSSAAALGA